MTVQPTQRLAEFVAGLRFDALPAAVRERTVEVLLDTVACAFLGSGTKESAKVEVLAQAMAGAAGFTVIAGRPQSLVGAVLVNGYQAAVGSANAPEYSLAGQFAPCVVAAALAAAEHRQASGRDLVTAVAAGLEVAMRIERGMNWAPASPVWHAAGIVGPLGSAAAVALLFGGDVLRVRNTLSLSGTQSAGTLVKRDTPTMQFHQARAGVSGMLAALLAETGFNAGSDILNADHGGLFRLCSQDSEPEAAIEDLGTDWLLAAENPPESGRSEVLARFRQAVGTRLLPQEVEQVVEMLAGLERLPELGKLCSKLREAAATAAQEY